MAKKLNQNVMTLKFRSGLELIYAQALEINADDVTAHIYGGATVILTDAQLAYARKNIEGFEELSGHGNSGKITVVIPAGLDYVASNRPTLSDEERKAKQSSGKGIDREEAQKRKQRVAELRARLKDVHGIDLDSE
jgi:hypothetical protein